MSPRRRPKSERESYHHGDARAALIEAAAALVTEQGPGFSLREAARRTGVDPAGVYRHFRDRADLLAAVAQRGFFELGERMEAELARSQGTQARLIGLGRAYVAYAVEAPAFFRLMFGESGFEARDPRLRPEGIALSPYERLEAAIVAWAEDAGREVDVEGMALMLWAAVHGVARLVVDGAVPLSAEARGALVARLCVAALA